MDNKELKLRCDSLKANWSTRDKKIREWYDILTLKDELKQDEMESVVSNDPRTGYNLAKHLMTSSIVAHKISTDGLKPPEITATSQLEKVVTKHWRDQEVRYRGLGRQSFKGELCSFMLSTGWYCLLALMDSDKFLTEVWNPIEVYPDFSADGLVEVVNIYRLSPAAANRKIKLMGWNLQPMRQAVDLYNYWGFDDDGDVVNAILLNGEFVKPLTKEEELSRLSTLPVFMSPVAGLPDRGAITESTNSGKWQEHFGEAIVATNENLGKNYNKMLTFLQQLVRDTANPRWFEQSDGDSPILKQEDMFKRGAIFRGSPNDDIKPLPMPPIPVELRTALFDYQNMLQRGLFPWSLHGNVQQQMSYLAMANIASAAVQALTPYMDAYRGVMADVDNYWVRLMKAGSKPAGFVMPKDLPKDVEFSVQADIEIPGYLIQRANVARMLNPNFRLPHNVVVDKLFPEVQDPLQAQAEVRRDDAMMHPKAIMADQIIAYREHAVALRKVRDEASAKLYEKLASSLESELVGIQQQPMPKSLPEVAVPREVMPGEVNQPLEGMSQVQ